MDALSTVALQKSCTTASSNAQPFSSYALFLDFLGDRGFFLLFSFTISSCKAPRISFVSSNSFQYHSLIQRTVTIFNMPYGFRTSTIVRLQFSVFQKFISAPRQISCRRALMNKDHRAPPSAAKSKQRQKVPR
jgi:hypothetical protein